MPVATRSSGPDTTASAGATPMMAQYLAIRAQASETAGADALVFYRMGDFYELFFDDAVKAAEALDIALTHRGKHQGADIPMCGVPVATAETYLSRLIAQGFRVAVCEQTEDPKEAKKRGAKAVVRREIVRVVTPGTITEDALLEARDAAWILAVAPAGGADARVGLAWADVTTGAFGVGRAPAAALDERIAGLGPREVLLAEASLETLLDAGARAALERAGAALTPLAGAKFNVKSAAARLKAAFAVDTLEGFGAFAAEEIAAAGALVDYLSLTQAGAPVRLAPPARTNDTAVMAIDPATRASLEIARTLAGDRKGSLLHAIDRTATPAGARLLAQRIAQPLTDPAAIARRLDAVAFFVGAPGGGRDVASALARAGDPARAVSRLVLGRGGPRDLVALAGALEAGDGAATAVAGVADEAPPHELAEAMERLRFGAQPALAALAARVRATIREDAPLLARDGGFVRAGADTALDDAQALRDESRRVIAALEARYRDATGLAALKIKHNNVLGYFVEVTARQADRLMAAPHDTQFIHRQTMANAVRFTTTELADLERRMAAASSQALARELALFDALVADVTAAADALRAAGEALATLDVAAANALWAAEMNAARPVVDDSLAFDVEAGRHPVVEHALRADGLAFAPNDCRLDGAGPASATGAPRLAFVTGPNMAGKSTYLRQNAVMAILAQAGCFVPAKRARIGVADRLFSRVGAADDLARGRSTFMAEMVETAAILNQAGPRAFVILDEIGRGTATYDGLAIAWAVAEHLHDINQARAMFATHYHELTRLTETLKGAANLHLRAKAWNGDLIFLHEVAPGAADRSYGVEVARRAGLPKAATARAQEVLERLEGRAGAADARLGVADALEDLPLFQAAVQTPKERVAADEAARRRSDPRAPVAYPQDPTDRYESGFSETGVSEAGAPAGKPRASAADGRLHALAAAVRALDPDDLTPRDALDALYRLQAALEEEG